MNKNQIIGMALTIMGGTLWGLSGTAVQFLETERHINVEWLISIRLIAAGLFTVIYAFMKARGEIFRVFTNTQDTVKLFIFGVFGMAMCQYSYFRSIIEGGVGVATVLQYIAPTMIIVYTFLRYRKSPTKGEVVSVILALVGTMCIVFHEGVHLEGINSGVISWGLLSAVGVAIYSVQPVQILRKYGTGPIVGLAMLISGILAKLYWFDQESNLVWDAWTWAGFFAVFILGTVVSFNAYLEGIRRIGSVQGSILSSIEPISAALLGWWLLGNTFTAFDAVGFIMILSTVFILGYEKSTIKS